MKREREVWIDNVKVVACLLVVLGHVVQGMVACYVMEDTLAYRCFIDMLYTFHVPLFFVCSGYLYQKYSCVRNGKQWAENVGKKLITLGIPYLFFSILVWTIKILIPGAGTNKVAGLGEALLWNPISPYWFLYVLILCNVVTPTFRRARVPLLAACFVFMMTDVVALSFLPEISIHFFRSEVWFLLGMELSAGNVMKKQSHRTVALVLMAIFLMSGDFYYRYFNRYTEMALGLLACSAVIVWFAAPNKINGIMAFLARYNMPIFLMHSVFIAALRTALIKIGVTSVWIHAPMELAVGIIGPIVAAMVMKKLKYPEFVLYPGKFLK